MMKSISEMANIMLAYEEDGAEIQYRKLTDPVAIWSNVIEPTWNWATYDYRLFNPSSIEYKIDTMEKARLGEEIEFSAIDGTYWTHADNPQWNWSEYYYRVRK